MRDSTCLRPLSVALTLTLGIAFTQAACGSNVASDNPYDPDADPALQAAGRIAGEVFIEGKASQEDTAIIIHDAAGARVDQGLLTEADGTFVSAELPPGTYRVELEVPVGNFEVKLPATDVNPGATTYLGLLTSLMQPPDEQLTGMINIDDDTETLVGVRVVATRIVDGSPSSETRVTYTGSDGSYRFTELLLGSYELRADRQGLTPDLVDIDVGAASRALHTAPTMTLYKASGVVSIHTTNQTGGMQNAQYTTETGVLIELLAFGGAQQMRFSESPEFIENDLPVTWVAHNATQPFTLSDGEGEKTIYAQFRVVVNPGVDDTERMRTEIYSTAIVFDQTAPTPTSLVLAPEATEVAGKRYIVGDLTSVPYELLVFDGLSGVTGYKVLVEGESPESKGYDVLATNAGTTLITDTLTLSSGDGDKEVQFQFRDAAGNESALFGTTGVVDATPPTLTTSVNNDGAATSNALVQVSLIADDANGLRGMLVASDPTFNGATEVPFATPFNWEVSDPTVDGEKWVYVRIIDLAGNTTDAGDSIMLDVSAPTNPTMSLDSGAWSIAANTTANLSAVGADQVYLSGDVDDDANTFEWVDLTAGAAALAVTLTSGDGTKIVNANFRDFAGNEAAAWVSTRTTLDTVAPNAAMQIEGGAAASTDVAGMVTVQLDATDGLSGVASMEFRVGEDDDADSTITWGSWQGVVAYQASFAGLQLATPTANVDGVTRHVEARFADTAGNVGAAVAQSIVLDNVVPALGATPIEIDGGATFSGDGTVDLTLDSSATSTLSMHLSNGQGCTSAQAWQPYGAAITGWSLDGEGDDVLKYVSVQFRDAAGNVTACQEASIRVDSVIPSAQFLLIEDGDTYSANDQLALSLAFLGNPTEMYIAGTETGLDSAPAQTPSGTPTFDATAAADGTISVYVRLADDAGNVSNVVVDTIVRDTTPPIAGSLLIDGGASYATLATALVQLSFAATDNGAGVFDMDIRNGSTGIWTTVSFAATYADWLIGTPLVSGGEDDVDKLVQVVFRDAVGNATATPVEARIRLDNVVPSGGTLGVRPLSGVGTKATSPQVSLTLFSNGGPKRVQISNTTDCTGGITYDYQTSLSWTLADTSGNDVTSPVSALYMDAAGNASACVASSIVLDTLADIDGGVALPVAVDASGVTVQLTGTDVDGGAVSTQVVTTAAGTFSFSNLKAGTYTVNLSMTGHDTIELAVVLSAGVNRVLAALTMSVSTASVSGTMTLSGGGSALNVSGSAAGVDVRMTHPTHAAFAYGGTTSASGDYSLADVSFDVGGDYTLTASLYGYDDSVISVDVSQATVTSQNVTLTANLTQISGNLTKSGGADDSGISVALTGTAFNGTYFTATPAITNASGDFVIANIPAGTYTYTITAADHESVVVADRELAPYQAGNAKDLGSLGNLRQMPGDIGGNVALTDGGVSGFSPGSNFAGARVRLLKAGTATVVGFTLTDSGGDYVFEQLVVGDYDVEAVADYYGSVTLNNANKVSVQANATANATQINLAPLTTNVTGIACPWDAGAATSPTCSLLPAPDVVLSGTAFNGTSFTTLVTSVDAGGAFRFTNTIVGGTFFVSATATDHDPASSSAIVTGLNAAGALVPATGIFLTLKDNVAPTAPSVTTAHASPIDSGILPVTVSISAGSTDATVGGDNFVEYELLGGGYSDWVGAGAGVTTFAFMLLPNRGNLLQVRARDAVGNVSGADSVFLVHDSMPPSPPSGATLTVTNRDGEVEIEWTGTHAPDRGGYLLYYGSEADADIRTLSGNFADQGASPINVGLNTRVRLTGLVNETNFRVGVVAYDRTQEAIPARDPPANHTNPLVAAEAWPPGTALPVEMPLVLARTSAVVVPGASDLAVSGGYVYVPSASAGLKIYRSEDFYGAGALTPAATVPGETRPSIKLFGDVAYLYGTTERGMGIVAISDPESPTVLADQTASAARCYHSLAIGHRTTLGARMYGVYRDSSLADCSDTGTNPSLRVHRMGISDTGSGGTPRVPRGVGNYQISSGPPSSMIQDSQLVTDLNGNTMLHVGLATINGNARDPMPVVGGPPPPDCFESYCLLDVDDPNGAISRGAPTFTLGQGGMSPALGFEVSGHLLFSAADRGGFDITLAHNYDFNGNGAFNCGPAAPGSLAECQGDLIRSVPTGSNVADIKVLGNLLILSTRSGPTVAQVWDISDIQEPRLIGSANADETLAALAPWESRLQIDGDNVYVVVKPIASPAQAQLLVYDFGVARYLAPRDVVTDGNLSMPTLQRNFLLGFDTFSGLVAYDARNVDVVRRINPSLAASMVGSYGGESKLIDEGRHLVVIYMDGNAAPWNMQIAILDVSNPHKVMLLASRSVTYTGTNEPSGIDVIGNTLMFSDSFQRLRSIDISTLSLATIANFGSAPGTEISTVGGRVYYGKQGTADDLCRAVVDTTANTLGSETCVNLNTTGTIDPKSIRARGGQIFALVQHQNVAVPGGWDSELEIWDRRTLTFSTQFAGHPSAYDSLAVSASTVMQSYAAGVAVFDTSTPAVPVFQLFQGGPGNGDARLWGPYVISGAGFLSIQQIK